MFGRKYLQKIKKELEAGRYQSRKGSSLLAAFGYLRRRGTALSVINEELKKLGIQTKPAIDEDMPLQVPYIHFYLPGQVKEREEHSIEQPEEVSGDMEASTEMVPASGAEQALPAEEETSHFAAEISASFKVAELAAASKKVELISPNESVSKAYTIMRSQKYSQLAVAESATPLATAIKGTISYQSIANALLNGKPMYVRDCLDTRTPKVEIDDDIERVINHLEENDVVLVIGHDKRLCGLITAWDLSDEFAKLVGPFKWIGEIESRVRHRLLTKIGKDEVVSFLNSGHENAMSPTDVEMLTLGDLLRIVQNPDMWQKLQMPYDRQEFSNRLEVIRQLRNRLMHFGDSLTDKEMTNLRNFCHMLRDKA